MQRLARPDAWAADLRLRVDSQPFTTAGREYVIPIMRDTSRKIVVKKAAQTAFTISFLIRTFHWIVERHWHHLYLLPVKTGVVIPFVQGRIDGIIDSHPYLQSKFKAVDNRTHKQTIDDIKLLVRGVNVESEMQETPVDVVLFDEYDRMVQTYLADAKHRTDGSKVKILTYLSTPSVPGGGVDDETMWHSSDQHHWEVPCPGCGRFQFWNFEDNLKLGNTMYDCALECAFCGREFRDIERGPANAHGRWTPYKLDGKFRGYTINQFSSPTMSLSDIMEDFFEGQRDMRKLKAFFNQGLAEPYAAAGDKFTEELLEACAKGPTLGGIPPGPLFIGVDQGSFLHVKASYIDRFGRRVAWNFKLFNNTGKRGDAWAQLDQWLSTLGSFVCVIDGHPEKNEARKLALKYWKKVWIGFEKDRPDTGTVAAFNKPKHGEPGEVIIDRTFAFDGVIDSYMNGKTVLPKDAREIGEMMPRRSYNGFYHQMMQQTRVEEEDSKGRIVARWQANSNPDHWHHADMFEYIATFQKPPLRINPGVNKAIKGAGTLVGA